MTSIMAYLHIIHIFLAPLSTSLEAKPMGTTQSLLKRVVLDALAADAGADLADAEAPLQQLALRLAASSHVSCTLNGAHQLKYVEDQQSAPVGEECRKSPRESLMKSVFLASIGL